jgi:transposase
MKTYSDDLRERVVRACDEGRGTRQEIADLFGVSTAWIRRLHQRRRETGSIAARPRGGSQATKMDDDRRFHLLVLVTAQPDATLAELRDRLGAPVHLSTIARTLNRLGWTVKKKSSGPLNRTDRTSGTSERAGVAARPRSTRIASCSSMKAGPTRR